MKILRVNYTIGHIEKANSANNYIPATTRHNSLSDVDFNLIADTIRCQNLKNQLNVRLVSLKRSLNNYMAKDLYKTNDIK